MANSGQTDAERRTLRIKQRELRGTIQDERSERSEKLADANTGEFEKIRTSNNELYDRVAYTREAVLDGENVELIASRVARQVDQLLTVPRYDADKLVLKLRSKCSVMVGSTSEEIFDWRQLGVEAGSCFNAVPTNVSFMNGPIDAAYEPKQRKKPERKRRPMDDDVEEEEVGTLQQKKKSRDQDKLSAAEKHVSDIQKLLSKKSESSQGHAMEKCKELFQKEPDEWDQEESEAYRAERPGEVCAVQFLFNPRSFTQTVENIFGLSFLVKQGLAKVGVRSKEECKAEGVLPGPYVRSKTVHDKTRQAKQAIVAMDLESFQEMVEAYNVEESDIPHRGKSKYAKKK